MNAICVICSDVLVQTDEVFHTECGHVFHLHCLTQWLERSKSCPQCREKVTQKKIHRLFFTFSNNEIVESNASSLQERIDNLKFQVLLKEKDIKYFTSKNVTLEKQNVGLRKAVRKVENEISQKNSAIHALKEQTKFFKEQSLECDNLKREITRLKKKIEDLGSIQVLLHGPLMDVQKLVGGSRDPGTLITYISVMKKELVRSFNKCNQLRTTVKKLQEELAKVNAEDVSVLEEQSKRVQLEEDLIFCESKNMSLQMRVKELEKMLGIAENLDGTLEIQPSEAKSNISKESTSKRSSKAEDGTKEKYKIPMINKRRKEKETIAIEDEISELENSSVTIADESIRKCISISDSPIAPKRSKVSIVRKENDDVFKSDKSTDGICTERTAHSKLRKRRDNAKKETAAIKKETCSYENRKKDGSIIDLT